MKINVNKIARKVVVDNRIPFRYYYKIADNLLGQGGRHSSPRSGFASKRESSYNKIYLFTTSQQETLSRHSFLGPYGLWGQWQGSSAEIKPGSGAEYGTEAVKDSDSESLGSTMESCSL
ncbi:hypothetical protein GH714_039898 [Hevea brasiliensis]|uniref:Uncharacterized protein n=1 Tax=Hevea brasiliensis TaxID=3981 RepID=A0A6A6M4P8_HEVBR|nr:hypothetical protein GH714_039898 [Hevea brasiliensis]